MAFQIQCMQQRHVCHCTVRQDRAVAVSMPCRRSMLAGGAAIFGSVLTSSSARALGLESVELPPLPATPELFREMTARNQKKTDDDEAAFENSDLLKGLREKSVANRDQRKKELSDKYCRRQAEDGVGDCSGLRLIPGMTRSGKQKTPEFLKKLLNSPEGQE